LPTCSITASYSCWSIGKMTLSVTLSPSGMATLLLHY
jgi:hypothetical protein